MPISLVKMCTHSSLNLLTPTSGAKEAAHLCSMVTPETFRTLTLNFRREPHYCSLSEFSPTPHLLSARPMHFRSLTLYFINFPLLVSIRNLLHLFLLSSLANNLILSFHWFILYLFGKCRFSVACLVIRFGHSVFKKIAGAF